MSFATAVRIENVLPTSRRAPVLAALALGALLGSACHDSSSGGGGESEAELMAALHHWNGMAVDASGLDHTPGHLEHPGPGRSSRAMAMVHIALFEVVLAVRGGYTSYLGLAPAAPGTSLRCALAQAAHDTLAPLYGLQATAMDQELADELTLVADSPAKSQGVALGQAAAAAVLALRNGDGSELPEPLYGIDYVPSDEPGKWRQDPISMHPLALGAHWSQVTPFALASADQFRCPPPPALTSAEYTLAYEEVKVLGGDGVNTPTARSDEGTLVGLYWAYDGTPSLCAPPRLYNQIAFQIAQSMKSDLVETARLLALVNIAMADAGIASWESKYFYEFWRPVTGIRESEAGTGPSLLGDGNPNTVGDASFTPLGAPASNSGNPNFTPPFPAYPSGHATFGGALFQTLRRFYGTDDIEFTFVSDEFNGVTEDNLGNVRPLTPRTFHTLSEAEEENGQSRIYLGIHWMFDKTAGIAQGREVADYVFDHLYPPAP
jgi:hypothetical protein